MCRACALSISAPRLSARHSSFSCFSQLSAHKFLPAMSDQGHLTLLNLLRTDRLAREERHSVYWLMPSYQGVRITTNLLVTGIRWVSLTVRCREQRVHWLAEKGTDVFSISSSVVVFVLYCSRNYYTNGKIGAAYVSSVFPILYLKDQNFFQ